MRDAPFILIVAAPSIVEAHRVACAAGIALPNGAIRHVRNHYGLRSCSHGTPVLCGERGHWPAGFSDCLTALLGSGRLRIAQDADIQRAKEGV